MAWAVTARFASWAVETVHRRSIARTPMGFPCSNAGLGFATAGRAASTGSAARVLSSSCRSILQYVEEA